MTESELTEKEAYLAAYAFLDRRDEQTRSNRPYTEVFDLDDLLGSMQLLPDGNTADPAVRYDWCSAVRTALAGDVNADYVATIKMTEKEAYRVMHAFVKFWYELTESGDLALVLSDLSLLTDGSPEDPAIWYEWHDAVRKALAGEVNADLVITPDKKSDIEFVERLLSGWREKGVSVPGYGKRKKKKGLFRRRRKAIKKIALPEAFIERVVESCYGQRVECSFCKIFVDFPGHTMEEYRETFLDLLKRWLGERRICLYAPVIDQRPDGTLDTKARTQYSPRELWDVSHDEMISWMREIWPESITVPFHLFNSDFFRVELFPAIGWYNPETGEFDPA